MNWDRIEGGLKQIHGTLQEHWGRFREDELQVIAGKRRRGSGELQERYGISVEEARRAIAEFEYRQRDWSTRR